MATETVRADALKVGDTILIAEGERTIALIQRDDPQEFPHSVVMTLRFKDREDTPFFVGIHSLHPVVISRPFRLARL